MSRRIDDLPSIHWQLEMLQSIDAGLVVLDREYRIRLWNGFMANHSALAAQDVADRVIFELFSELPEAWFRRKVDTAVKLNNPAFTTWEQRPYIFAFHNFRPLSGNSPFMYQNMTVIPLPSASGAIEHVCLIIYDVTDVATNKLQLRRLNGELRELNRIDSLTGLFNRGHWEEQLRSEFQRFLRTGVASSVVMLDIDHFKQINDRCGHQAGDEVIRNVSACLKKTARDTDVVGRYGGEEFAAILIDTDAAQARFFAERLRQRVEQQQTDFDGLKIRCTISLGIAEAGDGAHSYDDWLQRADQALYRSKANGRNRTTLADDPLSDSGPEAED